MLREGNLNILKLGGRFDVTFSRYDWPGGTLSSCKLEGLDTLVEFLENTIRIRPDIVREALRELTITQSVHIRNVRLTDDKRVELGLVSPDEALTSS